MAGNDEVIEVSTSNAQFVDSGYPTSGVFNLPTKVTVTAAETRGQTLVLFSRLDLGRTTRQKYHKSKKKRKAKAGINYSDPWNWAQEAFQSGQGGEDNLEGDEGELYDEETPVDEEQMALLASMGLPTSFAGPSAQSSKAKRKAKNKKSRGSSTTVATEHPETTLPPAKRRKLSEQEPNGEVTLATASASISQPNSSKHQTDSHQSAEEVHLRPEEGIEQGSGGTQATKSFKKRQRRRKNNQTAQPTVAQYNEYPEYGEEYQEEYQEEWQEEGEEYGEEYQEETQEGYQEPVDEENAKYWIQRYHLFSKFDEGCKLDKEGWYSVTPEQIAKHIATKVKAALPPASIVLDGMCGPGGNTIQFAAQMPLVFTIDLDPNKIAIARHNATIYGVQSNIEFIIGDFVKVAPKFRTDCVFLSPPWGGPDYINQKDFDLHSMTPDGYELIEVSRKVSPNIGYLVPRNTMINQLIELARDKDNAEESAVELEQNFINGRLKTLTAYYGALATKVESSDVEEQDGQAVEEKDSAAPSQSADPPASQDNDSSSSESSE